MNSCQDVISKGLQYSHNSILHIRLNFIFLCMGLILQGIPFHICELCSTKSVCVDNDPRIKIEYSMVHPVICNPELI